MSSLEEHIEFVNGMMSFQLSQAKKFAGQEKRASLHVGSANKCAALIQFLESIKNGDLDKGVTSNNRSNMIRLNLVAEEIEDLPPELLEELSISESDKTEFKIVTLINEMGGVTSLDRLLVAFYKKTGEVMKRMALNQRLYRMSQKDMVFSVPGKKGIYSTRPYSEEDANKLGGPVPTEPPSNMLLSLVRPGYQTE